MTKKHRTQRPATVASTLLAAAVLASLACSPGDQGPPLPGEGDDAGQTVLYRDHWGVAHIYAPTIADGLFAMGYAQAEDRPTQLIHNILIAIGEYSSAVGSPAVPSDLRSHMWNHYGIGKKAFESLEEPMRSELTAYADGINAFYDQHPEDVPAGWQGRRVDEAMILAFGRLFLYNWSIDEAYEDLARGGIDPGWQRTSRGSNQFAISPERSASGNALLAIDPHLAWEGPSRFWEFRIHAGELVGSGVNLAGSPYIGLGHNQNLAWAMTTGGPDTADVFELTVRNLTAGSTLTSDPPPEMLWDGEWQALEGRTVELVVAGEEVPQSHTLWFAPQGPIIAAQGDRAYAGAVAYGDAVTLAAWRTLSLADDYTGAITAMEDLTLFPQNVMVADTAGNIYYQRTGRVPRRSADFDYSLPVDGSISASAWQGFHPASDHLQVLNPEQGWMQNCNIPPDAMMPNSPFRLDEHPDYVFSGPGYGPARSGWTNQRGARAIELLVDDDSVTVAEARAIINDVSPYGWQRWIDALRQAHEAAGAGHAEHEHYGTALEQLFTWDGQLAADSRGGLTYDLWRNELVEQLGREGAAALAGEIDHFYRSAVLQEELAQETVSPDQAQAIVDALASAASGKIERYGSLDATYGDRFRVGRGENSWPAGGGGDRLAGTRTLRSMSYGRERDDHTRWGRGGQTSTQIVELSSPPKSWMYIPLGQSDRPDSPHFSDQAAGPFADRELKPTNWLPEDLASNIASRVVLETGGE